MTAEQNLDRLKEFFGDSEGGVYNYAFNRFSYAENFSKKEDESLDYKDRREVALLELGLGEIKEVDQYGGEGKGDTWYTVKHFVDHDVYIRTDGFYSSYNGTDFYDGFGVEVKPTLKTITVYE